MQYMCSLSNVMGDTRMQNTRPNVEELNVRFSKCAATWNTNLADEVALDVHTNMKRENNGISA